MNRFAKLIMYGTIVIAFSFICVLMYWAMNPYKTAEVFKNPFLVVGNKIVHLGGTVTFTFDFCNYTKVVPETTAYFAGKTKVFIYSPRSGKSGIPRCAKIDVPYKVPNDAELGKQKLVIEANYYMNPIRVIHREWESEEFEVIK